MKYRLDLHVHSQASPDGRMTLAQIAERAKKRGVDAVAICDHNRCTEQALFAPVTMDGVLFIPSVEYSTEAGHLLGLFLEHPCRVSGEEHGRVLFSEAATAIHEAGGLCVLAHPYELTNRSISEISQAISQQAPLLDGIEIFNCRATKKRSQANALAAEAARGLKPTLLRTAGSDAHTPREVGRAWVCVEANALSLPALRAALANPLDFSCGKCPHMSIARSQLTHIYKDRKGPAAYAKWLVLVAVCALRALKGVFL